MLCLYSQNLMHVGVCMCVCVCVFLPINGIFPGFLHQAYAPWNRPESDTSNFMTKTHP
jgi:hypothetical protein